MSGGGGRGLGAHAWAKDKKNTRPCLDDTSATSKKGILPA